MANVIVVGAGTMGAGIAAVAALAGDSVSLIEPEPAARSRAQDQLQKNDALKRVTLYDAVPSGLSAEVAIEAVPEHIDLKLDVFKMLAAALPPETILATNTSSLPVGELAESVKNPQRVVGMHFFNPPTAMKLVEIVCAQETSDETIAKARAIVERFGKTAVIAADTPGFIVNRVARPFYLQAMRAYEAGVAPIEDLDRLARGAGFRMGPFELMDFIGLDVNLATSQSIFEQTGERRLEPVMVQRQMVAEGRLGRKTGAGFYDYANGAPPKHDDAPPQIAAEKNQDERILLLGLANVAIELRDALDKAYAHVNVCENEEAIDEMPLETTVALVSGDGVRDRGALLIELDHLFPPETVIFADAYATDLKAAAKRMRHPERLAGFGILGSLEGQSAVEIVNLETTGDDALALAQELFEAIGKRAVLVEDHPGLFLGRTIGSIVNEAVVVVQEDIATPEDVDLAMRLGTNYPLGPIAWGREIGGDRIVRILQRLAGSEGAAFAPHRALWVLDVESEEDALDTAVADGAIERKPGFRAYPGIE